MPDRDLHPTPPGTAAGAATPAAVPAAGLQVGGRGGLAYIAATAVVNIANLVFHVVISRQLGTAAYGATAALLNLVTFVSLPLFVLQAAVVRSVASGAVPAALRRALGVALAVGVAAAALLLATSPLLESFLALGSIVPVVILAAWLPPSVVSPVLGGALLGRTRAGRFAAAAAGGAALRLGLTIALGPAHLGIDGPLIGTLAGALFGLAVLLSGSGDLARAVLAAGGRRRGPQAGRLLPQEAAAWQSIVALGGYASLVGIDTVMARHALGHADAGLYAAAGTAGRIAYFLPATATVLAFPRFLAYRDSATARRDLVLSAGIIGGVGLAAAAVMAIVPRQIAIAMFGSHFAGAAPELRILGLEGALLGLVSLFTYFYLARRSPMAYFPWIGAVAAVAGVEAWRPGPLGLAYLMLAVAAALVVVMGVAAVRAVPAAASRPGTAEAPGRGGLEGPPELDLTVVVPFFDPGERLAPHLEQVRSQLAATGLSFEIVAVSDGTSDGSDVGLEAIGPELRVVRLPRNRGKGYALREGFALSRGVLVAFIDGDGDIPARCLGPLVAAARNGSPHFVVASKLHPASEVVYPWIRRIYSTGYRLLVRALMGLDVTDTQTGLKLMRREVLAAVLPLLVESGFALDLELLAVGRRLGFGEVAEVPVTIQERFTSSISGAAAWTMLLDTVALAWRLRVRRSYDRGPATGAARLTGQSRRSTT